MDHFERELVRMMRDAEENNPFENGYRRRLRAGIRTRREARTVWLVTGSALTVLVLGVGPVVLSDALTQGGPTGPEHHPASATPVPATSIVPAPWRKPTEPEPDPRVTDTPTTSQAPWMGPTKPAPVPVETGDQLLDRLADERDEP